MPVPELSCKFYVINPGLILPVKLSQSHNNNSTTTNCWFSDALPCVLVLGLREDA